jgi:hypothetical protein
MAQNTGRTVSCSEAKMHQLLLEQVAGKRLLPSKGEEPGYRPPEVLAVDN